VKSLAQQAKRVKPAEIAATAASVVLPDGVTDLCMVVDVTKGESFPDGTPKGIGVETRYGPAWVIDGRGKSAPIALYASPYDARDLYDLIAGPEGELWQRRERRRQRIAELEAAEAAAAEEAKSEAKTLKRLARRGVDVAEATGGGSSRRERSSSKRLAGTRMRVEETMLSSPPA
jgi:hypothetical protein